jgi:hypothetical protein
MHLIILQQILLPETLISQMRKIFNMHCALEDSEIQGRTQGEGGCRAAARPLQTPKTEF